MEQNEPIIIQLRNRENRVYTSRISVGAQTFWVSFNTGMHGIWIPGRIRGVAIANQVRAYDAGVSPTYHGAPGTLASIRLRNRTVTISGRRRTEHILVGQTGHFVLVGPQEFVVYRTIVPRQFYLDLLHDGFVGLGFAPHANINAVGAGPIWMRMMNQGLLTSNRFSLYLRDYYFSGTEGGYLTFGGVNQAHYVGHHRYFDLVDNSNQWKIHMYSVSVEGHLGFDLTLLETLRLDDVTSRDKFERETS